MVNISYVGGHRHTALYILNRNGLQLRDTFRGSIENIYSLGK